MFYTCSETVMNVDEYKKMVHYFPQTYWAFVMRGTILNIIFTLIIANISTLPYIALIFFVICQIFIMILYKKRLEHYAEKAYNSLQKGKSQTRNFIYTFMIII